MALTIKGTPQKVKAVGTLQGVSNDSASQGAVRAADKRREEESRRRGGKGARKP